MIGVGEPQFYISGRMIFVQNSSTRDSDGTTTISVRFPVATATLLTSDEDLAAIVDRLNRGNDTQAFAQGAEGWLPIDSAPKDGTLVVLGAWIVEGPDGNAPPLWVQRVGRWTAPPGELTELLYGWGDMGGTFRNKNNPRAGGVKYPTHWHPLPSPPEVAP